MRLAPPPGERALPLLAGGLLAVAHPPFPFLLPAFVGLVPLLVFIAERPPGPGGRWAATRGALITGLLFFGVQLVWVLFALLPFSPLAVPAYTGMVLVLAGLVGVFGWALHITLNRTRLPLWLLVMLLWTTLEWLPAHLGPMSFPWLGLGTALAPTPILAGGAELVGARGLSAWLAAVNGVVAELLVRTRSRAAAPSAVERQPPAWRPRWLAGVAGLAILLALPPVYGAWRASTLEIRPALRVALVHPDLPQRFDRAPPTADILATLTSLTEAVEEPVDLVVWPEVALRVELEREPTTVAAIRSIGARIGAPILVGAYGSGVAERSGPPRLYNSAFLIRADSNTGGRPAVTQSGRAGVPAALTRYDKQALVPFVERVPAIRGHPAPARYGGLSAGGDGPLLHPQPDAAAGVLICFESVFAPLARARRRDGADVLINMSNDSWFARHTPLGPSLALWQHPAHLVLRAIETRAGIARSANGGVSMVVDPLGRVTASAPGTEAGVLTATTYTTDVVTLFVRWGDWVGGACVIGVLLLAAATASGAAHRGSERTDSGGSALA